jgi:hypothetical protein
MPPHDLAAQSDPAGVSRDTPEAPGTLPELAFGARWLALEPVMPAGGTPDALPSPATERSIPAGDAPAQPKNTENTATSGGAHAALLDDRQSEGQGPASQENTRTASAAEEGHATPQPGNAGPLAGTSTKNAAASMERPMGGYGDGAPAGHADAESVWNTAAPTAADREAQPAAPAQAASVARPAEVEPPEQAAPPVSRDVSLHLADGESSVDIRMAERGGEVRVIVHTPNRDLAEALRADLPDLIGKLRQNGFQAEAWRPAAATQSDAGRRSGSDASPFHEHAQGGRRNGRQRQPQQPPKNQTRWDGEWKSSLGPAQETHI